LELVKFDTQAMQNPEISGVEYQQGTLAGYEVREYLLEKWNRACAYCGKREIPLQIEHIQPRAHGGTDRVSNLTLSCEPCNLKKGTQSIDQFLKRKPDVLKGIQAQARAPLKDTAAMNATSRALFEELKLTGLPIECGSGGLTKYHRSQQGLPKTHWQEHTWTPHDRYCYSITHQGDFQTVSPDVQSGPIRFPADFIQGSTHGVRVPNR
jgi:hypothetical protein